MPLRCGTPEVDVAILRQHTRYGVSVNPNDPHIAILWEVLTSFTMEQRSMFLSFIWGRNRLPATDDEWGEQCMKIHTLENSRPDGHFPVSHTCFFSLEWPRYSSTEVAGYHPLVVHATATMSPQCHLVITPTRSRGPSYSTRSPTAPTWTWTRSLPPPYWP